MTVPKIQTLKRGGSRFYVHPETKEKAPGVTSIVGMLPKEFLKYWAAKVTAEAAVENFGAVANLVAAGDSDGAVDYLKRAQFRTVGGAALKGTEVHEMTEAIDEAGAVPKRMKKALLPYAQGYLEFRQQTEVEILEVETTIWSQEHGYSGTLDRVLKIPAAAWGDQEPPSWWTGEPQVADVKTTRSGVHAEVAIQMAAYRAASEALRVQTDGSYKAEAWPVTDVTGLVIHLRPEAWKLVPVRIGPDVFEIFKALLVVHGWDKDVSKDVLYPAVAGRAWDEGETVPLEKILAEIAKEAF